MKNPLEKKLEDQRIIKGMETKILIRNGKKDKKICIYGGFYYDIFNTPSACGGVV